MPTVDCITLNSLCFCLARPKSAAQRGRERGEGERGGREGRERGEGERGGREGREVGKERWEGGGEGERGGRWRGRDGREVGREVERERGKLYREEVNE